jgi:hypothetical protein
MGSSPGKLCVVATLSLSITGTCSCNAVLASNDDTSPEFSVGVKTWATQWSSWAPVPSGHNTITVVESVGSVTRVAVIPQVSMLYDHWLAAASYFVKENYSLEGRVDPTTGTIGALSAHRWEADGNIGYYLIPGFAVTVGYKQIDQAFGSNDYTWRGPTIGAVASVPLRGPLGFYGTFAYGRLRLTASTPDAAGDTSFNADYLLGELGLSYTVWPKDPRFSFSANVGFRAQQVSTRRFAVSTGFGGTAPVDVYDTTTGPVVSVIARF